MAETPAVELVVARYREDVGWLRNVPRELGVHLYDKGGDLDPADYSRVRVTPRPNEGVEAETYFHHLESRYDELAPVTVFAQGHPFDHAHDLHKVLRRLVAGEEVVEDFRWLGFIIDSDDPRGRRLFVPWSKNLDGRELDLGGFYQELFGEEAPEWTHFYPGAQFVVTREAARRRPREFYARARELAIEWPDGGHCFERTWDRVFQARGVDPAELGGHLVRYLKPIKRLRDPSA
jgi:hypothetical protein